MKKKKRYISLKHAPLFARSHVCECTAGLPRLLELPSEDLQVVEGPAHSQHHLGLIAGSHADVPALRLLPLAHQRLAVLEHQPHGARRYLEAQVVFQLVYF